MSSEVPVYKLTLLGMAEAGKTALATQIVCSAPPVVYQHTTRISSMCCEVRRPPPPEGEEPDMPLRYGVELQDSPGELNDQVLDGTPEHMLMHDRSQQNPRPSNAALRARARKAVDRSRGDVRGEGAPLIPDVDNRNVFARARAPAGYVVVFDALSAKSYKKAKQILSTLGKADVQLALFANKADLIKDDDEEVRRRLEDATNLADDKDLLFMVGSAMENYVEIPTKQGVDRVELTTLLHELTARIGGEDWDAEDAADADGLTAGWCSFWCCAPTYG